MKKIVCVWLLIALVLGSGLTLAEMPREDRAGNPIAVPETVETIVSLAPSITRVIVDIGLGEKLVAVDTFSEGIEGVPENALVFDIMTPDAEQIVALSPDLVLLSSMTLVDGQDPLAMLLELEICVAFIPSSDSIEGILEDTLFIGTVAGNVEGAQALCDTLTAAIEAYRVETDTPVSVYFEISPMPYLYSFGSDTFLNEIIELLGGRNIFADQISWISVSEEAVIAANPAIIFTNADWQEDAVGEILGRAGWESVEAVENETVFLIEADASSQPNHRIVIVLEAMAEAMRERQGLSR